MKTVTTSILVAILLGLLLGGGQALAHSAATPPTIMVQVIGAGKVTATGINCGLGHLGCTNTYSDTSTVTLTESTTSSDWTFDHWDDAAAGCPGPPATTCDVAPSTTPTVATAVFVHTAGSLTYHTFSVSTSADTTNPGGADGLVSNGSSSYGITCGDNAGAPATTCSQSVPLDSTMTVQEGTDAGFSFNGWGGSCSGTQPTCSAYLSDDRAVSAEWFSSTTNALSISVAGSGTVTGGGITCAAGATCTKQEPPTSTITLTESPADGYAFTGWSGSCTGTQTTCTVQMNSSTPVDVTATFAQLIPVLITVNGAGTVSGANVTCGPGPQTCSGSAAPDSTIVLTATPSTPGGAVSWIGCDIATGTECTLNDGADTSESISATFSGGTTGGGSQVTLSVSVTGDGVVSTSTTPGIWCTAAGGAGCTITVQQNTSVQLHAAAASNAITDFNGWGGACPASLSTTCTLLLSSAKSVSAGFAGTSTTYNLSASVSGGGSISGGGLKCSTPGGTGCSSPQPADEHVTLVATPNPGGTFTNWGGACSGSGSTCTVIMSSAQNVTASFSTAAGGGGGSDKLTLTVTGGGTVAVGTTKCASTGTKSKTCSTTVGDGTAAQLKATPNRGYKFTGWVGGCKGTKATCAITTNADVSVGATFKALPIAAAAKKPTIAKLHTGYRVTISLLTGEAGKVTVTTKPTTTKLTKAVKAGANIVRFTVKKRGRYTFTVSLRSKSGTHALHYKLKV